MDLKLMTRTLPPTLILTIAVVAGTGREMRAFEPLASDIQRFTVSRSDELHESFPDLEMASNGDLVVTYQESESHGGGPVSAIVTRVSSNQGRSWGKRTVVNILTNRVRDGWLASPRITRLKDGSLLLAVDHIPQNPPKGAPHNWSGNRAVIWLYRSHDNGRSWSKGERTSINRGIAPNITQLKDGTLLIGVTRFDEEHDTWRQYQLVYLSDDNGKTWSEPVPIARHRARQPNEGDMVELNDGTIVCYMRDDQAGVKNGLKAFSQDGGRTWSRLFGSGPWVYSGRPDVGLLSTGEVFLTSRVGPPQPGHWFGAYLETQKQALEPTPLAGPATTGSISRLIDNDTNPDLPDRGYSGWVELKDGSIYVVQYITSEAPAKKPFIRGYLIPRSFLGLSQK